LTSFISDAGDWLGDTIGVGVVLLGAGLGALLWFAWREPIASFLRRLARYLRWWNRCLGGVALFFALSGLLALFGGEDWGGRLGEGIIGDSNILGALAVLGLVFAASALFWPRGTFRQLRSLALAARAGLLRLRRSRRKVGPALGASLRRVSHLVSWPGRLYAKQPFHISIARRRPRVVTTVSQPPAEEEVLPPPRAVPVEEPVETPAISVEPSPAMVKMAQELGDRKQAVAPDITLSGWQLPAMELLERTAEIEFSPADIERRAGLIEDALASYGVEAKVVQVNPGPTVTQFGVEPGWDRKYKKVVEKDQDSRVILDSNGSPKVRMEEVSKTRIKVDRIRSLESDIALALAAPSIKIEAPVPGKPMVGIEVPNSTMGVVTLRGIVESAPFQKQRSKSKLAMALGKGVGGEEVVADLAKMPHLLIAGATGSGKTVCLNSIICCLLLHNGPDDLQFIMIDPKQVELVNFNSLPHLVTTVINDTEKAVEILRWLQHEMDKRYRKLASAGARNIEGYNRGRQPGETLPQLVLVVDELADLMMAAFDEVERSVCRLAQMARATGIHLVIATQRPSVDVISGLIKANFPTRISFAVTSIVDSRTILDSGGAEKLLGKGDMLYLATDASRPKRLQGCFVSEAEIERLVYFWGAQRREEVSPLEFEDDTQIAAQDPLLEAARRLVREHKHISTSFLQRRLRIGHTRAARLMDQLEENISEEEGPQGLP
jgi:S-DNA-T family DNA segregation ATPase FtsK/SpoIIIE